MSTNTETNIKNINIIYWALIMGQVSIFAIFLFLNQGTEATTGSVLNYVSAALTVTCITIAFMLYNKHKDEAKTIKGEEEDKIEHYRKTSLIRWALIEGANLVALVFFFLEGNYLYLLFFAIGMGVFFFLRPSKDALREDYGLQVD